jgi:hypothetical protein
MDRLERVRRVVSVARRIADPSDTLGREARARLPEASGLSAEGVELALREHLETDATAAELAALVASCAEAPRCHVVLAANVCTAPLRALACALATAPAVAVKPSRRDPVVAELLARELDEVTIVDAISAVAGDEAHVYGADATVAAIAATLPAGVLVRGHGTGFGIAVVERATEEAARAVADDLVPFDGRGCLSPRLVIAREPEVLAQLLHDALAASRVPRGDLHEDERAALARFRATYEAVGAFFEGPHHAIGCDEAPVAIVLPPEGRVALVIGEVDLAPVARLVTAIGGEGALADRVARSCARARRSSLGRMQKPPLDGPVDLRTVARDNAHDA